MKRFVSALISILFTITIFSYAVIAEQYEDNVNDSYLSQLSSLIQEYSDDSYFDTMSVTIGESYFNIDGEKVLIDESGTVAYVENGRTMMPVRAIAEAIGADVSYEDDTQSVVVENDEKTITMSIDDSEMIINGESVELLNAPVIVNDRTMLPVRDVAEALDCEVLWEQETETATFTRPLQTKRLIIYSDNVNAENAVASVQGNGYTILQFDKISDASEYIEKYGDVLAIEPDFIQKVNARSWGVSKIGSENYYNQVSTKAGSAIVAVIDSGIDYSHTVFQNRITEGHDFWHNDNYCEDEDGHGTHVASIVLDVAGFNSNIKIMPLKVFGSGGTTPSSLVAAAIEYAANHGANVVNLSLGGSHHSDIQQKAVNYALTKNVAIIAAAGNERTDLRYTPFSPGGLDGVITISSIDSNNNLAYSSNYGDGIIDFAAPGVSINGAKNGGGYITMSGTSMAAPHASGAYALVISANPELSVDEVTNALKKNAINIGSSHFFGAGMICLLNLERILPIDLGASTLKIDMTSMPDSIKLGNHFGLRGIIASNYQIVSVNGYIKKGNDIIQSTVDTPYGTVLDVRTANLNNNLIFNNLTEGDYILLIEATDVSGNSVKVSRNFKVYSDIKEIVSSLSINLTSYPNSINQGSAYGLRGTVTSNNSITKVLGYVLNASGNTVLSSTDYPNSTSMDIRYAHLNNDLVFNNLSAGNYTMKVIAVDSSGTTREWSAGFVVNGINSNIKTGVINIPSNWDNLSIRTGPGTNYQIIGSMNQGEKCIVYTDKTINGWYYVEYNGIIGYASGKQIYLQ